MFEDYSADMCAWKFPLVLMGGRAEGLAFTDQGARTPIGASRNSSNVVGNWMSIKILMEIYLHIASYEDLLTGVTDFTVIWYGGDWNNQRWGIRSNWVSKAKHAGHLLKPFCQVLWSTCFALNSYTAVYSSLVSFVQRHSCTDLLQTNLRVVWEQ